MKNQKFDVQKFLNVKTLSPLEETQIVGGTNQVIRIRIRIRIVFKKK